MIWKFNNCRKRLRPLQVGRQLEIDRDTVIGWQQRIVSVETSITGIGLNIVSQFWLWNAQVGESIKRIPTKGELGVMPIRLQRQDFRTSIVFNLWKVGYQKPLFYRQDYEQDFLSRDESFLSFVLLKYCVLQSNKRKKSSSIFLQKDVANLAAISDFVESPALFCIEKFV